MGNQQSQDAPTQLRKERGGQFGPGHVRYEKGEWGQVREGAAVEGKFEEW